MLKRSIFLIAAVLSSVAALPSAASGPDAETEARYEAQRKAAREREAKRVAELRALEAEAMKKHAATYRERHGEKLAKLNDKDAIDEGQRLDKLAAEKQAKDGAAQARAAMANLPPGALSMLTPAQRAEMEKTLKLMEAGGNEKGGAKK